MQKENHKLTWHTYPDHLKDMMQEMMTRGDFTDVTLVSHDMTQTKAHRNILSICSPIFKTILEINSDNHPVIYLRGIGHSEIEAILHFLYMGEVNVCEERLNDLFQAAKDLKIKGLKDKEIKELSTGIEMNDMTQVESNENNVADENMDTAGAPPHTLHEEGGNVEPQANNTANRRVRRTEVVSVDAKFPCQDCERTFSSRPGLWHHTKTKHEGVKYACNDCDQQFTQQGSLTVHIQSKHEGVKYACNQCNQQYSEQGSLTKHIQSRHDGVKYVCNQCDKQYREQGNLTRHIQSAHEGVKYTCNQCDKQLSDRSSLHRHIKSKH